MTSFCRHPQDQVVLSCRLWIGRLSRAEADAKDTDVDAAVRCCLHYSNDQLVNCLAVGCDQFKTTNPDPLPSEEFPGLLKKRLQAGSVDDTRGRLRRGIHRNHLGLGGKRNPTGHRNVQQSVELPLLVKRWNSRVCMETHCKQSALDKLSYVTCGMQFCNGA